MPRAEPELNHARADALAPLKPRLGRIHLAHRQTKSAADQSLLDELVAVWRAIGGKRPMQQLLFSYLWLRAERRPGQVDTSRQEMAHAIGKSDASVRSALPYLIDSGLVEVLDDRGGALRVYVNDPATIARGRLVKASPQRELPIDEEDYEDLGEPAAQISVRISAQKSARRPAEAAQISAQESARPTGCPPPQVEPAPAVDPDWRQSLRAPGAQISAQESAPPMSNERLTLNRAIPNEQYGSMSMPMGRRRGPPDAERELADFAADAEAVRQRESIEPARPLLGPLVGAINRLADGLAPEAQRQRLREQIIRVVADPDMHESLAGRAADAVVHDGLDVKALNKALDEVNRMRRARTIRTTPGRLFHTLIREACQRQGVVWRGGNEGRPPQ